MLHSPDATKDNLIIAAHADARANVCLELRVGIQAAEAVAGASFY